MKNGGNPIFLIVMLIFAYRFFQSGKRYHHNAKDDCTFHESESGKPSYRNRFKTVRPIGVG